MYIRTFKWIGTVAALVALGVAPLMAQQQQKSESEVENVHKRLFHKGPVDEIPYMLSRGTGDLHLACVFASDQHVKDDRTPAEHLRDVVSQTDLAVVAKAGTHTTHITENNDFLYSDWNFSVEEVVKNNVKAPVALGATIRVARPLVVS